MTRILEEELWQRHASGRWGKAARKFPDQTLCLKPQILSEELKWVSLIVSARNRWWQVFGKVQSRLPMLRE